MSKIATIHFSKVGGTPTLDVIVPQGTLPNATARLNEYLTRELIPRVTGHPGCYSGVDFRLREAEVENTFRVNLETGKVAEAGG
jgi:hypothetical protein